MRVRLPSPLGAALALVALLALRYALVPPGRPTAPPGAVPDDRVDDRIVGTVGGPRIHTAHGYGAPLEAGPTTIWLWCDTPVEPGERIVAIGRLRTPRGLRDPGVPDRATLVASRGAELELTAARIERLADTPGLLARAWRWAAARQAAWAAAIGDAGGSDAGAAALRGIVTGDRGDVPDALDRRWRAVGIYHVLSVSGLHLAVVAGLAFALLRRIFAASPWGGRIHPARWAALPALVLALGYTLITGAQLATVRALVVVAIVLGARALDRPLRLLDALGLAAILVLAWRPADLLDPSFQLSFAAALTLALRPRGTRARTRRGRIAQWCVRGATTSAWVVLATAPITAYHFHQVAAFGVLGNLVLTPLVELVALPLGLAGVALGSLGTPLVHVAAWLVGRVDALAGILARVAPVGTIAVGSATVMAGGVALAIALSARRRRGRLDAIGWLLLCAIWALGRTPPPAGALRVTFLDVGQGDAALIELPDGATWLVDAGGLASRHDLASAAAPGRAIARTLEVYGRRGLDLVILSHPHPDHYLGLAALDGTVPIGELWSAAEPGDRGDADPASPSGGSAPWPGAHRPGALPSFAEIAAALARRGTRLVHPPLGVARREAGVELAVWAPRLAEVAGGPEIEAADPVRSVNDNSLVVTVRYAGRTVLFAGDLEAEGEEALVDAGLPEVDVVKVAHHGSPTSSSPRFVEATRPSLAVISCGVANAFGFPDPEIVARWRQGGSRVERTDRDGAITITIAPSGALAVDRFAPGPP